jgi:hypothetical protein
MAHLWVCDNCRKRFEAVREDQRFCTAACRAEFRAREAREARALWRRSGLERQLIEERVEQQQRTGPVRAQGARHSTRALRRMKTVGGAFREPPQAAGDRHRQPSGSVSQGPFQSVDE